jgi:hypothetical protein
MKISLVYLYRIPFLDALDCIFYVVFCYPLSQILGLESLSLLAPDVSEGAIDMGQDLAIEFVQEVAAQSRIVVDAHEFVAAVPLHIPAKP